MTRMFEEIPYSPIRLVAVLAALLVAAPGLFETTKASSHREAPAITLDPTADNTDLYAFVSKDDRANNHAKSIPMDNMIN